LIKPADRITLTIFFSCRFTVTRKPARSFTPIPIITSGIFSKSIHAGAKRIVSSPSQSVQLSTAVINPNGKVSVVVLNKDDKEVPYLLWIKGQTTEAKSLPHSIQTIMF
jgi:hypothetical protein